MHTTSASARLMALPALFFRFGASQVPLDFASAAVSNLNKKIYAKIEAWRNRRIEGEHPYLYLDGIVMKRSWAGEVRNVSLLVASAVNSEGFREILGICEGAKEDKSVVSKIFRTFDQATASVCVTCG